MFNIQQMMKQAQEMQDKLQRVQAEAELMTVTAQGAGGKLLVNMTGKNMVQSIKIDPALMSDAELLEDLLKVTINDAVRQAQEKVSAATQSAMGPLAGKVKLPF